MGYSKKGIVYVLPTLSCFSPSEQHHKLGGEQAILKIRDVATAHAAIDEIVTSTVAMKSVSQ